MILLLDKNTCPACGAQSVRFDQRRCNSCKARLFKPDDNWDLIHHDWILGGWIFFPVNSSGNFRGWVAQAHLNNPQPLIDLKPAVKPDKSYGTKTIGSAAHTPEALGVETFSVSKN